MLLLCSKSMALIDPILLRFVDAKPHKYRENFVVECVEGRGGVGVGLGLGAESEKSNRPSFLR